MIKRFSVKAKGFATSAKLGLLGTIGAVSVATPALAEGPIDDMFAAVNITGVSTNVTGLLLTMIGINVLFLAAFYIKKTMNRGR